MIYLDNAATTPLLERVKETIIYHLDDFGNPSSIHSEGTKAKRLLEEAREKIASCIHAEPDEIIFTSGGTESNNLALNGANLVVSNIEHHSILNNRHLITKANESGVCLPTYLETILEHTFTKYLTRYDSPNICSVMLVNNEIGTIQPIKELASVAHKHDYLFHTDAVAACGYMPIDVKELDIDAMSIAGHKFGAPKGIGALYIKKEVQDEFPAIFYGGSQEFGIRPGTENVIGAYAMAVALESMTVLYNRYSIEFDKMKQYIEQSVLSISNSYINCYDSPRCNHIISARFDGVDAETLVLTLDSMGVAVSAKSACSSSDGQVSHVLKAIGLTDEEASSTVRISIGPKNSLEEVEIAMNKLKKAVEFLRKQGSADA